MYHRENINNVLGLAKRQSRTDQGFSDLFSKDKNRKTEVSRLPFFLCGMFVTNGLSITCSF